MSGEGGHGTSARKRKDKKKSSQRHRGAAPDRGSRSGRPFDVRLIGGVDCEDDDYGDLPDDVEPEDEVGDDDSSEDCHAANSSSSTSHGVGLASAFVFVLLLGGLVGLGALIFAGLKDSNKEVATPIGESRYASLLSDFVDERVMDGIGGGGGGGGEDDEDDVESTLLRYDSAEEDEDGREEVEDGREEEDGEHIETKDEAPEDVEDVQVDITESQGAVDETVQEIEDALPTAVVHETEDVTVDETVAPPEEPSDAHRIEGETVSSVVEDYANSDITNSEDFEIRTQLDEADREIDKESDFS